jgi:hypothetical protein
VELSRKQAAYFIESKNAWNGVADLRQMLQHSENFSSADPRDLIYAFIGLSGPAHNIEPDYSDTNTILHLLIAAAQSIIKSEDRLYILDDSLIRDRKRYGMWLPSWVPEWTSPPTPNSQELKRRIHGTQRPFNASRNRNAMATFIPNDRDSTKVTLKVHGLLVGILSVIEHDPYDTWRQLKTSSGLSVVSSSAAHLNDQVWVLYGANDVYVLREENNDNKYSLVGEASVWERGDDGVLNESNIMYGEMIDREARGEIELQEISIV